MSRVLLVYLTSFTANDGIQNNYCIIVSLMWCKYNFKKNFYSPYNVKGFFYAQFFNSVINKNYFKPF